MTMNKVHAVIELRITPQRDCGFGKIAERISRYEQVDACFRGALLEHIDRLVEFGEDIHFFVDEHHSAALDPAEVEQLLDDARQTGAFLDNDAHAAVKGAAVECSALAELHGFRPALDGGKRRSQLVRDARDKVVFHLFGGLQILCHVADRLAEVADFVVVFVLDFF